MELDNKETPIPEIPNLIVANLDPIKAASEIQGKCRSSLSWTITI